MTPFQTTAARGGRLGLVGAWLLFQVAAGPAASALDEVEPNDRFAEATFLGGPLELSRLVELLEVEGAVLEPGGSDFYSFTASAGAPIAILVEPLAAPGSSAGERDLGVRVSTLSSPSSHTLLSFALIDAAGAGESEYHPPTTYEGAGFLVVEVFSEDLDHEQPYRLTISNHDIAPQEPARIALSQDGAALAPGDVFAFPATPIGAALSLPLSIENLGTTDLVFEGAASLGGPDAGDFRLGLLSLVVAPGESAALSIRFAPRQPGTRRATLRLASNDPDAREIELQLVGQATGEAAPAALRLELGLERLDALDLEIPASGSPIPVSLGLAVDARGRSICGGSCSFAGAAVEVKGKRLVRSRTTGRSVYRLRLLDAAGELLARIRGEIGSGSAKVVLSGPSGATLFPNVPVALSAAAVDTRLGLAPEIAPGGAIGGEGSIESGLRNDAGRTAARLEGTLLGDTLSFRLTSTELGRRISFEGVLEGGAYVGKLRFVLPPARGRILGVRIGAEVFGR